MTTFFVNNTQINNDQIQISGDDFHHIKNVLRLKIGEELNVCDENLNRYLAKVASYDSHVAYLEIIEKIAINTELPVNITLFQGLPKQEKMELIIQKTTEIGVKSIVPVQMERSIAKIDSKNEPKKLERWQKIAKEASIQSGRQTISRVFPATNFQNIIENIGKYDIVLLPYENEENLSLKECLASLRAKNSKINEIAIIIGPEGGFSEPEINRLKDIPNVYIVSLGSRILRTETASIVAVSMLSYEFGM